MERYIDSLQPFRVKFIYYFSAVGILSTSLFGVVPHLLGGNYGLATYEAFLVLLGIFNLLYFHKKRNYKLASRVILGLMILVLCALIITGGYRGTGIVWIYTFPLLSFFMKSHRVALLWNIFFLAVIALLQVLDRMQVLSIYYSYVELRQAGGAYIAVTALAYFYSHIINSLVGILREKAIRDPLTGLYNRDFVFENLEKILERLRRNDESSYCVAYIDLDRFKLVNDRYGHQEGDRVLRGIAGELLQSFRKGDIVGRVGGDEFLVIIYNCDLAKIEERLAQVRERVSSDPHYKGISLSYGVVKITERDESVDSVIKRADRKMYDMKRSSRG